MRVGWTTRSPVKSKWIWELEPSRLHAIDFFTYRLGLFSDPSTKCTRKVAVDGSNGKISNKKRNANRLNKLSEPLSPIPSPYGGELTKAHNTAGDGCSRIFSFSPLKLMQRMMREWEEEQRELLSRDEEILAREEAQMASIMKHPSALFGDEAAVLYKFGMGAFVSPNAPGFSGIFRQHWKDFLVTEMVYDSEGEDGKPLSRELDWTIPPLPDCFRSVDESDTKYVHGGSTASGENRINSFFTVDIGGQLKQIMKEDSGEGDSKRTGVEPLTGNLSGAASRNKSRLEGNGQDEDSSEFRTGKFYLQCYLRKQHIAHSVALSNIAQTLRMHPSCISVAGIKDYIGDTLQRVRLQNVTPASALEANRVFRKKKWAMTLSDFSYHTEPLFPGRLFGNHFKIVLRDVTVPKTCIQQAVYELQTHGFPNYYGCQRFSWFGGTNDAAFAILNQNWLAFAFRFLGYTSRELTLRELLQREKKYPNPVQDEYRRNIVRRLRSIAIEPSELDTAPFLACPSLGAPLTATDGGPVSKKQELILLQLQGAYLDLSVMSRRLTAQRLCSYLWNQVLTLRLHHFGGKEVLEGDMVLPEVLRRVQTSPEERTDWYRQGIHLVETEEERERTSIMNVIHPGFSFNSMRLPQNAVGEYFLQVCQKYHLEWHSRHSRLGIHDFFEPPRPIIRKPMNLRYDYDTESCKLTLEFSLERGSYANVVLTELMKQARCVGSSDILTLPAPDAMWEFGNRDPGYVTSLQDIYEGFQDGVGFVNEEHVLPFVGDVKPWDYNTGPLFLPESADPVRKAHRWGSRHLIRNMARREQDEEEMRLRLFEKPLAKTLKDGEVSCYAGHTVPLPPNAKAKKIFFKVLRRQRRYPGAPKTTPRIKRGAEVQRRETARVPFKTINKNTWNVTW
ncbi:tRNA pseudouridine synthase, putative [Trypanosoma equiperdum]|uniref:tRNA pseudouridine synthase, putative n=1 Tax=Trypanosoma equiperdum TaxID=5694 RepID=A0A1G4I803_TRYEQ|nr:tRNA pseudouridine synthase, putative [Trypanosoma equiperdum]